MAPEVKSPLDPFLTARLPGCVTVDDPSLEVLQLLRIVHAINRYWGHLYKLVDYRPIVPSSELVNAKLAAKANRQLQVNSIKIVKTVNKIADELLKL